MKPYFLLKHNEGTALAHMLVADEADRMWFSVISNWVEGLEKAECYCLRQRRLENRP